MLRWNSVKFLQMGLLRACAIRRRRMARPRFVSWNYLADFLRKLDALKPVLRTV
jgi:hypothetical protein